MNRVIRREWQALVDKLFASELTPSQRALALMELASEADILASDIRREQRRKETQCR